MLGTTDSHKPVPFTAVAPWKICFQVSPQLGEAGTYWAPRHQNLVGLCNNMPIFSSSLWLEAQRGTGGWEANIPYPLLSCHLLEQTLLSRGRKGICTVTLTKEPVALYFPSACSSEGPAPSHGLLTPKGGWPYEPVPALHPLQPGAQIHN